MRKEIFVINAKASKYFLLLFLVDLSKSSNHRPNPVFFGGTSVLVLLFVRRSSEKLFHKNSKKFKFLQDTFIQKKS